MKTAKGKPPKGRQAFRCVRCRLRIQGKAVGGMIFACDRGPCVDGTERQCVCWRCGDNAPSTITSPSP